LVVDLQVFGQESIIGGGDVSRLGLLIQVQAEAGKLRKNNQIIGAGRSEDRDERERWESEALVPPVRPDG